MCIAALVALTWQGLLFAADSATLPANLQATNQTETFPIGYTDFPTNLQPLLDQQKEAIKKKGGFCIAGRVVFGDGNSIDGGKDVMVNYCNRVDEPLSVYPNGWFIGRRPMSNNWKQGRIVVRAFAYDPIDFPIEPTADQISYIGLKMNRTPAGNLGAIQGRVSDKQGSPFGGATVEINFPFSNHGTGSCPNKKLNASADGSFAFYGLSPTTYKIVATSAGTAYDSKTVLILPGEVRNANLTLYLLKRIAFDYVCQTNGTRDFTQGDLLRGSLTWVVNGGGVNLAKQKISDNISDLMLRQNENQLLLNCFHIGMKGNGFYDAGFVDFESVTNALEQGYSTDNQACLLGHVYVVKTFDGYYAKMFVKSVGAAAVDRDGSAHGLPSHAAKVSQVASPKTNSQSQSLPPTAVMPAPAANASNSKPNDVE